MANNVRGFDALANRLVRMGKADFVKAEIAGIGFQMEADAKSNASAIQGAPPEIKQMISNHVTNGGFGTKLTQNALPMGAYIEFGTGVFVRVAPEWKDMAWQFYKNGKGTLHAHPYMYPAFIQARRDVIDNLRRKLVQLTG